MTYADLKQGVCVNYDDSNSYFFRINENVASLSFQDGIKFCLLYVFRKPFALYHQRHLNFALRLKVFPIYTFVN